MDKKKPPFGGESTIPTRTWCQRHRERRSDGYVHQTPSAGNTREHERRKCGWLEQKPRSPGLQKSKQRGGIPRERGSGNGTQ